MEKFPCIVRSALSAQHVKCNVCFFDFSVAHGGMYDVEWHVSSKCHVDRGKAARRTLKISSFMGCEKPSSQQLDAIRADAFYEFPCGTQHCAVCSWSCFREVGLWRSTPVPNEGHGTNEVLCQQYCYEYCSKASDWAFCCRDGRKPGGWWEMLPDAGVVCDHQWWNHHRIDHKSDLCRAFNWRKHFSVNEQDVIATEWRNCCWCVINANVMTGRRKGVISFMCTKVPEVHLAGCVRHLLNLVAKKATKASQGAFDFHDILRQMAWYVNKSSNRQHRLKQLQEECGTPQLSLVKHCSTRRLSRGKSLQRLLQQWHPLKIVLWGGMPTQEVQQQQYGDHQNRHHQDVRAEVNNKAVCLAQDSPLSLR